MKSKSSSDLIVNLGTGSEVRRNIRRSPYQALVAIVAFMATFYAVTIFALIADATKTIFHHLESKPQVTAFFPVESWPTNEQLQTLEGQLRSAGNLKEFKYTSKEQALEQYKELNKDNPELLEMVSAPMLPASLEVSTTTPQDLGPVAEVLNSSDLIEDVYYQKDVIDELIKWTRSIRGVGLENAILFAILSFLFVFIVMSMKIAIKRKEIRILQLVGASSNYISAPFVWEGLIYGMIGAFLGWGAAYTRLLYATPFLIELFQFHGSLPDTFDLPWMLRLLAIEMAAAGLWSAFATWLAVNRYLRKNT